MNTRTPKTQLGVKGNMSRQGADRVGLMLAATALTGVALTGLALILWVLT